MWRAEGGLKSTLLGVMGQCGRKKHNLLLHREDNGGLAKKSSTIKYNMERKEVLE